MSCNHQRAFTHVSNQNEYCFIALYCLAGNSGGVEGANGNGNGSGGGKHHTRRRTQRRVTHNEKRYHSGPVTFFNGRSSSSFCTFARSPKACFLCTCTFVKIRCGLWCHK